ncbi:MAG: LEA type 2 family protein [Lishizhenia sp.]
MKNIRLLFLLCLGVLLTGCIEYDDVEFEGVSNFKMGSFKEGKLTFDLDAKLFNPNGYAITVKPSEVDVFIEDDYIGIARLLEKVKMKKKTSESYFIPLELTLEKGAMLKLMRYALKKEINVTIKGKVKGSVFGLSKKISINQKKTISTKDFKL